MRRNVIRSLTICEFCQERLGSRAIDGVIVMTTPENQIGMQDCVSANKVVVVVPLPGILVLVR